LTKLTYYDILTAFKKEQLHVPELPPSKILRTRPWSKAAQAAHDLEDYYIIWLSRCQTAMKQKFRSRHKNNLDDRLY